MTLEVLEGDGRIDDGVDRAGRDQLDRLVQVLRLGQIFGL